jgi:hypothetical protein
MHAPLATASGDFHRSGAVVVGSRSTARYDAPPRRDVTAARRLVEAARSGYACRVSGSLPTRPRRSDVLFDDVPVDDVGDGVAGPGSGLPGADGAPSTALQRYRAPVPGRSLRSVGRVAVLFGGSAAIGVGVAAGLVTLPSAAVLAVGLASAQVFAQTWRQNRLGQSVVGGIALGDLDAARRAAERALAESPGGALRTLAASNLASVLLQQDHVDDAAAVLDEHPPRFLHMALTTVLWLNNRAFAHLARSFDDGTDEVAAAAALLDEAERRLTRATTRDLGGDENARKLNAALAATRALERTFAKDGKRALQALRRAAAHDDGPPTTFRLVERELCRTEALRLVGRTDEATITLESLTAHTLTPRQRRRVEHLRQRLEPS